MPKSRVRKKRRPAVARTRARARPDPAPGAPHPARPTPPVSIRFRPVWHKVVGTILVLVGVALVLLNFAENEQVGLLPGGHSPLYLLGGFAIAASSLWWFGAFDRE